MTEDIIQVLAGQICGHVPGSPSLLAVCLLLLAFAAVHAGEFLNLDFEVGRPPGTASGWYQGGDGYEVVVDMTVAYSGTRSLRIRHISGGDFGVGTQTFPVGDAAGKHLRYTGFIKTDQVTGGWAGLWWRVDGKGGILGFDNMQGRGAVGTTDWTEYSIELDIHSKATNINFGVLMNGSGTAWFDALQVELDSQVYDQVEPIRVTPTDEQISWLKTNVLVFDTEEPGVPHDDLMVLKDAIGDTRIVALGEGTHGTREFFKMKHRITEFLAKEMGFTVFAIEANMPEARVVNEYVLQGKGDPKQALAGMYFWTWNTQEVLDMIEWMRRFNESGEGHIEFWGFDLQFPLVAMDSVRSFVERADPVYLDSLLEAQEKIKEVHEAYMKKRDLSNDVPLEPWHLAAQKVLDRLESNREEYLKEFDPTEVDWAIQNARVAVQGAEAKIEGMASRDRSMAGNVEWILDHSHPDTKIVIWAHNGHVSKKHDRYPSMGSFLTERYGDDMVVFGFAFHEGKYTARGDTGLGTYGTSPSEPGSVEWALHETGLPRLILDLRQVEPTALESSWLVGGMDFRSIGAGAMDYAFTPRVVTQEFDLLIFFDKTHPSVRLGTRRAED